MDLEIPNSNQVPNTFVCSVEEFQVIMKQINMINTNNNLLLKALSVVIEANIIYYKKIFKYLIIALYHVENRLVIVEI